MIDVAVTRWAVWTPETEPDVSLLPPLLRRRMSRLTRMMLHVAYRVGTVDELASWPAVFGSRHGEIGATAALLERLARREPITAAGFSHSVHNAQVGLFSIAAKNRGPTSAVAAGADTFGASFLEAVATMQRRACDGALLVVGDERLPDVFARFEDEPSTPYAVAIVLGVAGTRVTFGPGAGDRPARRDGPDALAFIRWLERGAETLTLGARTPYTWTRRTESTAREPSDLSV